MVRETHRVFTDDKRGDGISRYPVIGIMDKVRVTRKGRINSDNWEGNTMKKFTIFFAAMLLLFCVSGQAVAYFSSGDLIQVVYKSGGTGNEVLTDLGDASSWINSGNVPSSTFTTGIDTASLSTMFPGASWSDLNVAYFIMSGYDFWTSGPADGQTNNAGQQGSTRGAMNSVLQLAATYGTSQVSQESATSGANTYWNRLDQNGVSVGRFGVFVNTGLGEANLEDLASGGSAELYLYYYPTATDGDAGSGLQVAKLTIFADGHTAVAPVSQDCNLSLTTSISPSGSGTITRDPDKTTYCPDEQVTLAANPGTGYDFSSWSGVDSSNGASATVTMNGNKTVTANFTQTTEECTLTLTTSISPSGSGTITKNPDKATYCASEQVQLTANPATGYDFGSWAGVDSSNGASASVTMNSDKTVTANFTQTCDLSLTININPAGGGTVTRDLEKTGYCPGDQVNLHANPLTGYAFSSWNGADSSNGADALVTMDGNKTVTANFSQLVTDGPDLTGSWASCVQQCKGSKCKLNGKFQVQNSGNESAASSSVKFYLSYDNIFSTDDSPLKEIKIGSLKPGKSKNIKFNYSLASNLSATDKYIIAVIDPDNKVSETLENNNSIATDQIPRANLTGAWAALIQTCKSSKKGVTCSLNGRLGVQNNGNQNATSSVKFYLSDNSAYESGDALLKQMSIGTLKPGQSKYIPLKTRLSTGISATGKYVIAIIDQDNAVAETNEGDNMIISEPVQ